MSDIIKLLQDAASEKNGSRTDEQNAFLKMLAGLAANPIQGSAGSDEADTRDLSQALLVNFKYGLETSDPFFAMDEALHRHFETLPDMLYDGHELAMDLSDGTLYFYGPDADALLQTVRPVLLSHKFMAGAECIRRYGEPDDPDAIETASIL